MDPSKINSLSNAGFHFSFEALETAASELISPDMLQELQERKEALSTIIDQHIEREMQPDRNIRIAFLKFKAAYRSGDLDEALSDRTLMRRLSYCPAFYYDGYPLILDDEGEITALLDYLNRNWKDTYIIGLFSSMIQCWECENRAALNILRSFILKKIKDYQGNRHSILRLKQYIRFYEKDSGAFELGQELFSNGIGPLLAPEYLGLPRRWLEYEYFSQIISIYFEKGEENRETRYHQIFRILKIHPSKATAKRILSRMILELHENPDDQLREEVKSLAFERIGDPAFEAFWMAPTTFTEEEKRITEEARIILNRWITAQFISVFFEICITDERRKNFWLQYAKSITHFRVIGSLGMLQELRRDPRVADFLETRFQVLGGRAATKSAIMMRMNKYTLIEFSDTGFAFYAYRQDNPHCPSFNAVYTGLEELRDASMPIIPMSDGILLDESIDEGRLRHANQWETSFRLFLEKHVLG